MWSMLVTYSFSLCNTVKWLPPETCNLQPVTLALFRFLKIIDSFNNHFEGCYFLLGGLTGLPRRQGGLFVCSGFIPAGFCKLCVFR